MNTVSEWPSRVLQLNISGILWFLESCKQALQVYDKICKAAYGLQGLVGLCEPMDYPLCFNVPALTERNDTAPSASIDYALSIVFPVLAILNSLLLSQACCGQGRTYKVLLADKYRKR